MNTFSEQRLHRRIPFAEPVRIFFQDDHQSVAGYLVNLGLGGAYVRCMTPVEVGRQLVCAFFLELAGSRQLLGFKGTVRWLADEAIRSTLGPGFGLRFDEQRPDTAALLKTYVEQA